MLSRWVTVVICGMALVAAPWAVGQPGTNRAEPTVRTEDVDLFYKVFDAARGAPTAVQLQDGYLGKGSPGVAEFIPDRIVSSEALAKEISQEPEIYRGARRCSSFLMDVKARLRQVFRRLAEIDRDARFPPVTILIGRNNSGGTTSKSGVLIGLEVVCRSTWLQPNISDRLVHLIAHEYAHVQQFPRGGEDGAPSSVLRQSLIEGAAELIAELTSGEASESYLQEWTRGREAEIDAQFRRDLDSSILSPWLYNGVGTKEKPGDLGYWEGYRIAKMFYGRARNKRDALARLLKLDNPHAIIEESG